MERSQKGWTVEGGGRFTENFLGLLTHIEDQGSLQFDLPAPWCIYRHRGYASFCLFWQKKLGALSSLSKIKK